MYVYTNMDFEELSPSVKKAYQAGNSYPEVPPLCSYDLIFFSDVNFATDRHKHRYDNSTAKRSAIHVSVMGPRR